MFHNNINPLIHMMSATFVLKHLTCVQYGRTFYKSCSNNIFKGAFKRTISILVVWKLSVITHWIILYGLLLSKQIFVIELYGQFSAKHIFFINSWTLANFATESGEHISISNRSRSLELRADFHLEHCSNDWQNIVFKKKTNSKHNW